MVFCGKEFWTEEIPVYPLLRHLMSTGKYKNLLLTLTDDTHQIEKVLREFQENKS